MSQELTIVIPMAGKGSRFAEAGFKNPKPFIPVEGKPMITHVMDNLDYPNAKYVLIARQEHLDAEPECVQHIQNSYNATFIGIDLLTEGTACTMLFARRLWQPESPLLIANCDQIVDGGIQPYIDDCFERQLDGSILTFEEPTLHPKWSYAKINAQGLVTEVAEKKAISPWATVGLYLFTQASTFVESAIDMIIRNERVNNEFYTCPTYNYAIEKGKRIGIYNIPTSAMHGIGTPEDLDAYLLHRNQEVLCTL
ncbi:MAG: glycosyltransferase family 2 protein [Chlamydiales bacterium]|nr:glycosyltransferase family 2 protein [Chlamydiales bacterium]